ADQDDAADLKRMNDQYAVVRIGGKVRIVSLEASDLHPGGRVPVYWMLQDFCAFHLREKKPVQTGRGTTRIGIGQWWFQHDKRRQYNGVEFAPNGTDKTKFNLWTGFGCEALQGDCGRYLEHLLTNICRGDQDHYNYLLSWMALAVQHPERRGEVA